MTDDYSWLSTSLKWIENIEPEGFLFKTSTRGTYFDAFKLNSIKTDYFKNKIKDIIDELYNKYEDKEKNFVDIYSEDDPKDQDVTIISIQDFQHVKDIISQIFQNTSSNKISDLKTINKIKFCAMLFKASNNKSIIIFGDVYLIQSNSKKVSIVTEYTDNGIKEIKNPILAFNMSFPCIYFEEKEILLLLNRKIGEKIFQLTEHQKKGAHEIFKKLETKGLIKVDNRPYAY